MKYDTSKLITIAYFVGLVGDVILQISTKNGLGGKSGWGLKEYFAQHGSVESTVIAGGMMAFFYILYYISGLPFTILNMLIYGVLLDLAFRTFRIFPSLDGYYRNLNYFWSAVWGAIPMIIPLLVYKLFF